MKKTFMLTLVIAMLISIDLISKDVPPNDDGHRLYYNQVCGPVWDAPDPVTCEMIYELDVYHPLEIECLCRFAICLGWFYPNGTYDISSLESRGNEWDIWGEKDYWIEVVGECQTESPDHKVILSDIHWQYHNVLPWIDIPTDVNGDFNEDFQLTGSHPNGPTWGALHFRLWAGQVQTLPGAHGIYFFTNSLWAQYNF